MNNEEPRYDFRLMFALKPSDTLNGYELVKDGVSVDLHATEAAFAEADAKGLVTGALAALADGTLAVVVGRNTEVLDDTCPPAHYPVVAEVLDETYEYPVSALSTVKLPVDVVAKDYRNQNLSGKLVAVKIDERGRAYVVINEHSVLIRELFELRLA